MSEQQTAIDDHIKWLQEQIEAAIVQDDKEWQALYHNNGPDPGGSRLAILIRVRDHARAAKERSGE